MSVLIIFSASFGNSPTFAQGATTFLDQVEDQLKDSEIVNDMNTIQDYTSRSISKIGTDIQIDTEVKNLNTKQSTLVRYIDPETQKVLFINNIPVSLEDGHELSNIAVIYNEKGDMIQYTEMYLTKNNRGNFNLMLYVDGKKVVEEDTNEKFMTAEEYTEQLKEGPELYLNIGKLAKCLGISIALAEIIGAACLGVCWLTAGAGCIACVAGLAGFAVGGNSVCIVNAFTSK